MDTRAKRYSKKNRIKRKVKNIAVKAIKSLIKNIVFLIVGMSYTLYSTIRWFNDLVARFFLKLPRIMKVGLIYLLILNLGLNLYGLFDKGEIITIAATAQEFDSNFIVQNFNEEEQKEEECIFDSNSCLIFKKGQELGLEKNYILISIAISKWETGNYTSKAFNEFNNVGGMMCDSGLIRYNSLEEGINAFLINLKENYFESGLTTLELIQPKYCPIGAKNDPNNLNQYWLNGVKGFYKQLKSSS